MADEAPPAPHIPYTITGQEKTQTLTPNGLFQEIWRVNYEAPNGVHAYVEVPVREYTPAEVDRRIQVELENIMGVHTLGPQPHPENLAE